MRWSTPFGVGPVTITATATDGKGGTASVTRELDVATPWVGNVSSALTWSKGSSPYILTPSALDMTIEPSGRLTIDAGVKVYTDKQDMRIFVNGQLLANGTAAEPVTFRPSVEPPTPGFWEGIVAKVNGPVAPRVTLNHTVISHAVNAVDALDNSDLTIDGGKITFCSEPAVFFQSAGTLVVRDCVITNNRNTGIQIGLELVASVSPQSVLIEGDSIAFNGLFDEAIVYDIEAAISINVDDPGGGVPITITGCEVSRNDFPGIRLRKPVFPTITGNGIFGNELLKPTNKINIRLEPPFSGASTMIDGRNNYWGQTYADSTGIKLGIYDKDDNFQNIDVRVVVTPWLNAW